MPFVATWMDLEINMLNQTNKSIIWYHPYVESDFLNDTNQLIYKIETFPDIKNKHMIPKAGECGRGINQELENNIHMLLYTR